MMFPLGAIALLTFVCFVGASPLSPEHHGRTAPEADDAFAKAVMPKGSDSHTSAVAQPQCVDRSSVQEGQQECGNGALCQAGFRCTVSSLSATTILAQSNKTFQSDGLFGLKDLCEPESCDAEATRGGPQNMTCFGERRDGTLICGEGAAESTPAHARDLCDTLRSLLPSACVVDNGCFAFECSLTLFSVGVRVGAKLEVCDVPARASIYMDTIPASGTGGLNRDIFAGIRIFVPVPGLSFSIPGIGGAGGYALGDIEGSLSSLNLLLAVDACAIVLGFQVCGSSLTSSLPFTVLSESINFVGPCGGGPAPPPPAPTPGPPVCDTGYQCSQGFEVCGRLGTSCCRAEFAVACLTAAVPSGSCCRGEFPVCARDAEGSFCTRAPGLTTPCAEGGSCAGSTVCSTGGCCPVDFPVFCMTNQVPRTEQKCCSGDFPICVAGGCQSGTGEFAFGVAPTAKLAIVPDWVQPPVFDKKEEDTEPNLVL